MLHRNGMLLLALAFTLASAGSVRAQGFGELTGMARGKTDKADIHGFTEIYDHLLFPLRSSPIRICEIGIATGGSLQVWSRYFDKATVFGIDVFGLSELRSKLKEQGINQDFLPDEPESERLKTFVADQANRKHLKAFIDRFGGDFDVIVDDGGHSMKQQQISFGFLFKYVKPGGYYVIEDVHTSLPERYKGFGVAQGEVNTTLKMIHEFNRHARVKSVYLLREEMDYLDREIEYCNLFVRNNSAHSMTCIFKKRLE